MGLTHPRSLADWRRWQDSSRPLSRRVRGLVDRTGARALPGTPDRVVVTRGGTDPRVVAVLDALTPTAVAAVLGPLRHLDPADVTVLSAAGVRPLLGEGTWTEDVEDELHAVGDAVGAGTTVVSIGHYLRVGAMAHAVARRRGARFVTVQHGLLTPHAPPLAEGTTLLAWSEADAAYWAGGRDDVTAEVAGSQLLWEAAARAAGAPAEGARPVYLGQLHGAELRHRDLARAAEEFCTTEHAAYRPHPAETDRRSRATHRRLERAGVAVDRSGTPLPELGAPVVSVFSTGVLEAAAAGLPAWVHFSDPPAWLAEFWERYGMSRWGMPPTAAPSRSEVEPAARVAQVVRDLAEGGP